jgi:tetratricopeptide (TPR) repeat protein
MKVCVIVAVVLVLLGSAGCFGGSNGPATKPINRSATQVATKPSPATAPATRPAKAPGELSSQEVASRVLVMLNDGRQSEAEDLLEDALVIYDKNQRIVFLAACCKRSRFMVEDAAPLFKTVINMGGDSVEVKCAAYIVLLDARRDVVRQFAALEKLADDNSDDPVLRWMVCVQCRALNKNVEGVTQYGKLLKKWSPGPVLVHQTYANILDELKRYDEALVERHKTLEIQEAPWAYQGMGNTLVNLGRLTEARDAFAKAVDMAPGNADYWQSWGWCLEKLGDYDGAIAKSKKAIALDPKTWRAWSVWGDSLFNEGHLQEAAEKYRKALEINPANEWARAQLRRIEEKTESLF